METITSFAQARKVLKAYMPAMTVDVAYSLDRIKKLMDYLGNPQDKLRVIHVAGTSGKTSTSYFTASLLLASGSSVGLTVSPHIDEINERVQIDLVPLPEDEYCRDLTEFLGIVASSNTDPSYFEVLVAFAYWQFACRGVEYAVVEVGLGGLLDGTNVVTQAHKICVITDIGLDHTRILGETLSEITTQKAGIILPGNEVFAYRQSDEVMDVIRMRCRDQGAELHEVAQPDHSDFPDDFPHFQARNWYLARQAVDFVLKRDGKPSLSEQARVSAAQVYIPARMEVVSYKGKTLVIDGSHNEQKVGALVDSLKIKYPSKRFGFLVAFGQNKRTSVLEALRLLKTVGDKIIVTSFSGEQDEVRSPIEPPALATLCEQAGFLTIHEEGDPLHALQKLVELPEEILVITGSFYLLNHLRPTILNQV